MYTRKNTKNEVDIKQTDRQTTMKAGQLVCQAKVSG